MVAEPSSNRPGKTTIPVIEACALVLTVPGALWNLTAQVALLAQVSFNVLTVMYSTVMAAVIAVVAGLWVRHRRDIAFRIEGDNPPVTAVLAVLCLVCGVLALLAIRPDSDDTHYWGGRIVYFVENASVPLDLNYHDYAVLNFPVYYPVNFAHTIDLFPGYFARVLGCSVLDAGHFLLPFLGGAFIPLAYYLVLSRFRSNPLAVIVGVAAVVAWLCLDGGGHRSHGNFALTRIWQGKCFLISAIVPLFVAFSMDWFAKGSTYNWLKLFLLGVLAAGLSGTALFLVPVLSVLLAAGHLLAEGLSWKTLRSTFGYFVSLAYLAGTALYVRSTVDPAHMAYLGFTEPGVPLRSIWAQYHMVFGSLLTYSSKAFWAAALAGILLLRGSHRRFLLGWILAAAFLVFNPLVLPPITEHLTTVTGYWRLFYILPFPLTVGIAFMEIAARKKGLAFGHSLAVVLLLFVAVLAANLAERWDLTRTKVTVFGKLSVGLGHKIDPGVERDLREIMEAAIAGPMLSPVRYSSVISLYTNRFPQVVVRRYFLMHSCLANGQGELGRSRVRAWEYVSGDAAVGLDDLRKLLADHRLKNVVIDPHAKMLPQALESIRQHGFKLRKQTESFLLFVRE